MVTCLSKTNVILYNTILQMQISIIFLVYPQTNVCLEILSYCEMIYLTGQYFSHLMVSVVNEMLEMVELRCGVAPNISKHSLHFTIICSHLHLKNSR